MRKTSLALHVLICILFSIANSTAQAQKQFKLIVNLPPGTDQGKIEFWLENGKSNNRLKNVTSVKNQLIATGEYFGIYAAITIHGEVDKSVANFVNTFFVQEQTAIITFFKKDSLGQSLVNYSLENVEDFKVEKEQRKKHAATELKNAIDFEAVNFDSIVSGTNYALKNYHRNVLVRALGRKDLEYVESNPESYYSFYLFKNDVTITAQLPSDSLMMVFNKFPARFRYSDEGNLLLEFIIARSAFKVSDTPIEFAASDIHGKKISLSDYRNKKMILLHFWGTWCSPCIKELPDLKKIREQFDSDQLEIISITVNSNDSIFTGLIKKYAMDWTHIHNNFDIFDKYGNMATPRICLIDKNWKVIYDSSAPGLDFDLTLTKLNQVLTEAIQ